jgi:hypothetical protein
VAAVCFSIANYFFGDALPGGGSYAKQLLKLAVVEATTGHRYDRARGGAAQRNDGPDAGHGAVG